MEIHLIIGGVLFVAALVSVVVAVVMIAAALSPGRRSSNKIPERIFEVPSGGLSPRQGGLEAGQCYWDCLSGFHWAEDWEKRCSAACGLTEKPGIA